MKNILFNKYITVSLLAIVCLAIGFWAGSNFSPSSFFTQSNISSPLSSNGINPNLFNNVWNVIHTDYYYENLNNKKLYYGAINGMVNSLGDPHTLFFSPSQASQYYDAISGNSFAGIGVALGFNHSGNIIINEVLPNTPAQKAGLEDGDIIKTFNGKNISNINTLVNDVRGKSGTYLTLGIDTINGNFKNYKIERQNIHVSSEVVKNLGNGVVDVQILRFSDSTLSQWENSFSSTMSKVEAENPSKIILDLRGNPGGYFDAAVYAAGEFLPQGSLVAEQESRGGGIQQFDTNYQGNLQNTPLVILVNGETASSAEIFTGALQYYHRAVVVGENTYGKGTAQNVYNFSDGALLVLTTKHWLLPSGRWITPQNPIIPNVKVKFSAKEFEKGIDTQLQKAIEVKGAT
jgi:carboxyl-terminal processing protease